MMKMPSDYISRSELLEKFTELKKTAQTLRDTVYLDGVMAVIDGVQSASVEPVVHCSECRGWEPEKRKEHKCDICLMFGFGPDDFCSHGKRKDGGEE